MVCKYCGKQTKNFNNVCISCLKSLGGTTVKEFEDIFSSSGKNTPEDVVTETVNIPEEPKKTSKKPIIIVAVIAVIALLAGYFVFIYASPSNKIKSKLDKKDYIGAYTVFKEYNSGDNEKIFAMLEDQIKEAYLNYANGTLTYEEISDCYAVIKKMFAEYKSDVLKEYSKKTEEMKASKDGFINGEKMYSQNNYAKAILGYKKVLEQDCNYPTAQTNLNRAIQNYRNNVLSEAAGFVKDADYNSAVKVLKNALKIIGKDEIIEKRITEYANSQSVNSRNDVISAADSYSDNGDYAIAVKTVLSAIENDPTLSSDSVIKNRMDYYKTNLELTLKEKTDALIKKGDYTLAGSLLKEASDILGSDNKSVAENKAKLNGKIPVYLDELEPYSAESWSFNKGTAIDSFGNDRAKEANYIVLKSKSSATYLVEGYSSFSCFVASSKSIKSGVVCSFRVTANTGGDYIYKDCQISASTQPQEFKISTKKCSSITISISGDNADVVVYNAKLNK